MLYVSICSFMFSLTLSYEWKLGWTESIYKKKKLQKNINRRKELKCYFFLNYYKIVDPEAK